MSVINILDTNVSNLIAAGEVVERASNAIKELCENSMDAGAKNITVEIKNGGILFFRVTDDGVGMSDEDAILSVKRHATSKIKEADDLNKIMTFGFRGEALAAITSVTDTVILTKREEDVTGTKVRIEYGEITEIEETGCPKGTSIICNNLFKNTPARLKFLKSDQSEGSMCSQVVERLALSHPEIAYKFISDGNVKFSTTGDGKLKNAIFSIFGSGFTSKLAEVDSASGGISVSGFIGTPENYKGNRTNQIFYVNHRLVKNTQMTVALESAFKTHLMVGKFPVCILNIDINPAYVDVNIHPSKLEVKFSDEKKIFDAIYYSVKGVLESNLKRPSLIIEDNGELNVVSDKINKFEEEAKLFKGEQTTFSNRVENTVIPKEPPKEEKVQPEVVSSVTPNDKVADEKAETPEVKRVIPDNIRKIIDIEYDEEEIKIKESTDANIEGNKNNEIPEYKIRGELFNTYIIVEYNGKAMFVDKHAAHERINFERMKSQMQKRVPDIQMLLVRDSIYLTSYESQIVYEYIDEIRKIGYIIELNANELLIDGIPAFVNLDDGKELLSMIIDSLASGKNQAKVQSQIYFEKSLYSAACKASIKGSRIYDESHLRWIVDNIFLYDCLKNCPHGRTIAFEMTKNEFDKLFGRIQD